MSSEAGLQLFGQNAAVIMSANDRLQGSTRIENGVRYEVHAFERTARYDGK